MFSPVALGSCRKRQGDDDVNKGPVLRLSVLVLFFITLSMLEINIKQWLPVLGARLSYLEERSF